MALRRRPNGAKLPRRGCPFPQVRQRPALRRGSGARGAWGLIMLVSGLALATLVLGRCQAALVTANALTSLTDRAHAADTFALPAHPPLDAGLPQTATITARDGSVLAELDDVHLGQRRAVPLAQIAPVLVQATVAAEDRRFFDHPGVDLVGLVRALGQNAQSNDVESGASTLEMQVVRNLVLADERTEQTLSRKLNEAIAALELDRRFSKADILETYLNVVYYGHRAYGAEAAAQVYFGK
jgi:membrane peptidoglycan carboxypeptidase